MQEKMCKNTRKKRETVFARIDGETEILNINTIEVIEFFLTRQHLICDILEVLFIIYSI